MLVRNNPLIDYDALEGQLTEIRAALEETSLEYDMNQLSFAVSQSGAHPGTREIKAAQDANELFALYDEEFVQTAYLTFLKRPADPTGLDEMLGRLKRGDTTYSIALVLSQSDEGRQNDVNLPGFSPSKKNILIQKLRGRPVVGSLIRLAAGAKLLPKLGWMLQQWQRLFTSHQQLSQASLQIQGQLENFRILHAKIQARNVETQQQLQDQLERVTAENKSLVRTVRLLELKAQRPQPAISGTMLSASDLPHDDISNFDDQAAGHQIQIGNNHEFYLALENRFRGSESDIRQRLSIYLPKISALSDQTALTGKLHVDVGCGRGEWLKLLQEQGLKVQGIDLDASMVATCKEKQLPADCVDALRWLETQPDQSIAMISGFHIAEHLSFDILMALMAQSLRCLAPGGLLLLETPNPENLTVGANSFYLDPTHLNPIPPMLLQFMAEFNGFSDSQIMPVNPIPHELQVKEKSDLANRFNRLMYGAQDYALIAYRGAGDI